MHVGWKMLDKHQDFAVTYRVDKEGFEVLGFRTQLLRPGDLSFQDLVDRIHVVQVWPFREKQLSPSSEQSLQRNATQLRTPLHQQRELFSQKEFPQQEFLFTSCVASVTSEGLNLCRVKLSYSWKLILVNGFQMQKKPLSFWLSVLNKRTKLLESAMQNYLKVTLTSILASEQDTMRPGTTTTHPKEDHTHLSFIHRSHFQDQVILHKLVPV